jgi:hypothetical protein
MAQNMTQKTGKGATSRKTDLKSPVKVSKVAATKLGVTPPYVPGRLAGNHNETFLK